MVPPLLTLSPVHVCCGISGNRGRPTCGCRYRESIARSIRSLRRLRLQRTFSLHGCRPFRWSAPRPTSRLARPNSMPLSLPRRAGCRAKMWRCSPAANSAFPKEHKDNQAEGAGAVSAAIYRLMPRVRITNARSGRPLGWIYKSIRSCLDQSATRRQPFLHAPFSIACKGLALTLMVHIGLTYEK